MTRTLGTLVALAVANIIFARRVVYDDSECRKNYAALCTIDEECCSVYCFIKPVWRFGECRERPRSYHEKPRYETFGECAIYDRHHGNTSAGEKFNPDSLTCMHKTLPYNTSVLVTFADKSVMLRVNDHGFPPNFSPVKDRMLYVTRGAANMLGLLDLDVDVVNCTLKVPNIDFKLLAVLKHKRLYPLGKKCLPNWDHTCVTQNECCSKRCVYKNIYAEQGMCTP